jgi:hypothetical protein
VERAASPVLRVAEDDDTSPEVTARVAELLDRDADCSI